MTRMQCLVTKNLFHAGFTLLTLMCSTHLYAEIEKRNLNGDLGLEYSNYQSDYVSKQFSINGDVTYAYTKHEVVNEFYYSRKLIQLPNSSPTVLSDKYDANIKWKNYLDDSLYYIYLSPRYRHNLSGYYKFSEAMRVGAGKKILLDGDSLTLMLETGSGYRTARLQGGEHVSESLLTLSVKSDWEINKTLSFKFNLLHEQSSREHYRTAKASLKNKLAEHFGIVYEYTYNRAYPFDSIDQTTELYSSVGLAYEL